MLCDVYALYLFFFFKQKTAYEMRISDWSSDVCSSDLGNIFNDTASLKLSPAQALDDATPWAEAFRVLRTNMQFVQVDSPTKVFVVSSSLPAEGKSTKIGRASCRERVCKYV